VKADFMKRNKGTKDPRKWVYVSILDVYERNPPYREVILQGIFESVYLPMKQGKEISEDELQSDSF